MKYYLAIDIGASSGRHILGHIEDGKLYCEEVYRFENGMKKADGHLTWDTEAIFSNILAGLKKCAEIGKHPVSVAIDTWGVDYVLLDAENKPILPVYAYRDARNAAAMEEIEKLLSWEDTYAVTGIQRTSINTIYQLFDDKRTGRLAKAKRFLMMAEYFSYRLCGVAANEYTNASTTSLLNAEGRTWDKGLLDRLGYPGEIFSQPVMPPYPLGTFTDEVGKEVGYVAEVVLCPTHDTASAVAACPLDEGTMYISSGTWSLAGIETDKPTINEQSAKNNWTNEGGIDGKYRFLKNIMGLWLMQNVRIEDGNRHNHTELAELAAKSTFDGTFDVNDPVFTAPESMTAEIKKKLGEDDLSIGDLARSVYRSLALSYAKTAGSVQELTGKKIERILIVGGGSANEFLNEQTALACGVPVITGLTEGTAVGNIISQYMQDSGSTLAQAREIIKNSFDFKEIKL